jgi:hypothetical protein
MGANPRSGCRNRSRSPLERVLNPGTVLALDHVGLSCQGLFPPTGGRLGRPGQTHLPAGKMESNDFGVFQKGGRPADGPVDYCGV